jgi:hypothetical protein
LLHQLHACFEILGWNVISGPEWAFLTYFLNYKIIQTKVTEFGAKNNLYYLHSELFLANSISMFSE